MRIRALKNFSGLVSMHTGQELEIENEEVVNDLLMAGYVEASDKAEKNFSGLDSTHTGQEMEIENEEVVNDLLMAGYVEISEKVEKKNESKRNKLQ